MLIVRALLIPLIASGLLRSSEPDASEISSMQALWNNREHAAETAFNPELADSAQMRAPAGGQLLFDPNPLDRHEVPEARGTDPPEEQLSRPKPVIVVPKALPELPTRRSLDPAPPASTPALPSASPRSPVEAPESGRSNTAATSPVKERLRPPARARRIHQVARKRPRFLRSAFAVRSERARPQFAGSRQRAARIEARLNRRAVRGSRWLVLQDSFRENRHRRRWRRR
jgi:hypothetical protein